MTAFVLEKAWIDSAVQDSVYVEIDGARFTRVEPHSTKSAPMIAGLSVPGFANTHSHAFHRALRGRTQHNRGDFWTWRELMYRVAGLLSPDSYYELATAVYREMLAAGFTSVGEFHYLHHQVDGTPYPRPNAMGEALISAARDAGIRITLLDTLYLSSGFGAEVTDPQRRFSDATSESWKTRVTELGYLADSSTVIGVAAHSVRAIPLQAFAAVQSFVSHGVPVHIHLSEQVKENQDCVEAYGLTPTQVLAEHGILGPMTTVVHATHVAEDDIASLGAAGSFFSMCPTTERDLGDGIGPASHLHAAGARMTFGSDSHAVIDPFEEMRAVEMNERLNAQTRGHFGAAELLEAATVTGQASLGFADTGSIAVGQRADLVTIDLTSPRTAGTGADENSAVFAATAADITRVMVDGRVVGAGHQSDIGDTLSQVIDRMQL